MENVKNSYRRSIRFVAIAGTVFSIVLLTVFLNTLYLTTTYAKESYFPSTMILSIGIICAGMLMIVVFHKFYYDFFGLQGTVCLPKVIRITEAMALLHEAGNNRQMHAIRKYNIKLYKVKHDLGSEPVENIDCKEISGFQLWFFPLEKRNCFLGSFVICCNFDDIQKIIKENKRKWSTDARLMIDALQKKNEQLEKTLIKSTLRKDEVNEKEKSLFLKEDEITKTSKENKTVQQALLIKQNEINEQNLEIDKRVKKLDKQELELDKKLSIFLEAMRRLAQQDMQVSGFTTEHISNVIKASAQQKGIQNITGKLIELFRKNLPKDWTNQGGAPKQEKSKPFRE